MGTHFDDSRTLDAICYDLVLGDSVRATDRAMIQNLANGGAPYSESEAEASHVKVNYNNLTLTRVLHEARAQFANGFLNNGEYFNCQIDGGPKHKRSAWNAIADKSVNKPLRESIEYFEALRAKFGLLCLHGIAPAVWETESVCIPRPIGIEDALIPSGTYLGFQNLPFIVLRRSFTAHELLKLTSAAKRDPGWNMPYLRRCTQYLDGELVQLAATNWPTSWSPEKWEEMDKEGGGLAYADRVPTLDTFDIYAYVEGDRKNASGWVRRIILDSWSTPALSGSAPSMSRNKDLKDRDGKSLDPNTKTDFLYTSGDRRVAESWQNISSFQFADLSAVFPARYHSVRSLGWMLYAPCHLENRMQGKFSEAVFESLLMYFKVKSMDDVTRAMKLDLANLGFIDESLTPLTAQERYQVPAQLVELGMQQIRAAIDSNSQAMTNEPSSQDRTEKTKFQVMAELQKANALVGSALNQAYQYQVVEYREIFRRMLIKESKDPVARRVRLALLKGGIPEKYLMPERWEIESTRVMGDGNKTLEMMIAQGLMEARDKFDPEPQRVILRDFVSALTKNPAKALELVPETPVKVTPATHDAQLAFAALMAGCKVDVLSGINHIEYVESMLKEFAEKVVPVAKKGGMVDAKTLQGMQAVGQHLTEHIKIIAQDKQEKSRVKQYMEILGKLENEIKAFAQRLQEAMQKQQQQQAKQNGGLDPEAKAKLQGKMLLDQTKAKNATESHAQKTAQRQVSFEQKQKQDAEKHQAEIAKLDLEAASNIRRNRMTSMNEEGGDDDN